GLLDAYARKAVLQTILQVPTDSEILRLGKDETRFTYVLQSYEGKRAFFNLSHVVRAFRPNDLSLFGKAGVFVDRFWEFVAGKDRLRNEVEGSITKVIFGTLLMTMMMAVVVVPFGVITALYLREYAKQGPLVSIVRIAVNNLAGVPSIVFGIFGFGFFSIVVGGQIDDWLYPHRLPNPTYGGGGILWASLTLALLTVPVVIVATEEALASVPSAQREASLGCGASRFQTIIRVILPQATPGILTGTILAMARGAGEVAPLMLVGVVPSTEDFPIDGFAPFFHLERKFEHLGFHIFDLSFQYKEPDYARPFVFSSALLLLAVVASLNIFAIRLRNRLRRKFKTSHV
ncbi:MAG: phosphate ABC transporter permease PstA, partial [Planctomycetes bacterium]|nr:phosphate ABC transporter permease PstA [Planctomycetota bacterium]